LQTAKAFRLLRGQATFHATTLSRSDESRDAFPVRGKQSLHALRAR